MILRNTPETPQNNRTASVLCLVESQRKKSCLSMSFKKGQRGAWLTFKRKVIPEGRTGNRNGSIRSEALLNLPSHLVCRPEALGRCVEVEELREVSQPFQDLKTKQKYLNVDSIMYWEPVKGSQTWSDVLYFVTRYLILQKCEPHEGDVFIYYFLIHSPFFSHYPYRIHFHKIIHKHSLNTIQAVNYTIPNMEYIPHELENTYNSIFASASSKMNQKCQHASWLLTDFKRKSN